MIKSYKCTNLIRNKHFEYLEISCNDKIGVYSELFLIVANNFTDTDVIRKKLAQYSKSALRTGGSTLLNNYSYQNLGFEELINELSNRNNIIPIYIKHAHLIHDLLRFIMHPKILKSILIGKPRLLELIWEKIVKKYPKLFKTNGLLLDEVSTIFSKIFNYESFKRGKEWNTHKLQLELENKFCLYCNMVPLPEKGYSFDHFIPQTNYPIFAISLFNLIPSCTTCNTNNKKDIPFFTQTHIHPYYKDYLQQYSFEIDYQKNLLNIRKQKKDYSIKYKCTDSGISKIVENSFNDLKLLNEYMYHRNEIDNYLELIYFYDVTHIKSTINFISDRGERITIETLYRALFNREIDCKKFCCNSFSRLIYDICISNGVIDNLKLALDS